MRAVRSVAAVLIALALFVLPAAPLLALLDDSCAQIPCCKHGACSRMAAANGPDLGASPSCAGPCGQAATTLCAIDSLQPPVVNSIARAPMIGALPRTGFVRLPARDRALVLLQRPPPEQTR